MTNIFSMNNKAIVVVGGIGLIGQAICRAILDADAKLIVADILRKNDPKVVSFCSKSDQITYYQVDITKEKSIIKLINQLGAINGWVTCAYPKKYDNYKSCEEMNLSDWQSQIDAHLNGYFLCCHHALIKMKEQKYGSFVNISSIYGFLAPDFNLYQNTKLTNPVSYNAIKASIIQLSRYYASYYGEQQIRVNCVSPGGVSQGFESEFVNKYIHKVPLKRMAEPDDIAGGVLYLLSDAAQYVTGHNLVIDGGYSIT